MEKIKTYRLLEPGKWGGFVGHIIPDGKGKTSAIIMLAGDTEEKTNKLLDEAIADAPDKYKAKYDIENI